MLYNISTFSPLHKDHLFTILWELRSGSEYTGPVDSNQICHARFQGPYSVFYSC